MIPSTCEHGKIMFHHFKLNSGNLLAGLRDIANARSMPVDLTELVCQIFDDTGLQDIIDDHALQAHFPPAVCQAIIEFDGIVSGLRLSEKEITEEELDGLRRSALNAIDMLTETRKEVLDNSQPCKVLDEALHTALRENSGLDDLHAILSEYRKKGVSAESVYHFLESLRNSADSETDDRILELMDIVTGFCSPKMRIW